MSIVVPVYQVPEEQLRQCVDSLLAQTMKDIEVILVDDASPDACGVICDQYAEQDVRVHVIHQEENLGASVARNSGMAQAGGQWITFVDADDWAEDTMCQTMFDNIEKVEADILQFAAYINFEDGEQAVNSFFADQFRVFAGEGKDEATLQCIYVPNDGYRPPYHTVSASWAKLYRTEFLKKHDLKYLPGLTRGQDTLFSIRAFEAADTVLYVDEPVYHHRKHAASKAEQYTDRVFRIYNTMLDDIWRYIDEHQKPQTFIDAYYARVNGCLLSAINNDYFHPDNPKKFKVRRNGLKRLLKKQPYKEGLQHVSHRYFSSATCTGLSLLRMRCIRLYHLIWSMRNRSKTKQRVEG